MNQMATVLRAALAGTLLAGCAAGVPDSGRGARATDYSRYEVERARREAELTGAARAAPILPPQQVAGTIPQAPAPGPSGISATDLAAAGIGPSGPLPAAPPVVTGAVGGLPPAAAPGIAPAPLAAAGVGLDLDRTAGVQASPANAAPPNSAGISNQDFDAVSTRESIEVGRGADRPKRRAISGGAADGAAAAQRPRQPEHRGICPRRPEQPRAGMVLALDPAHPGASSSGTARPIARPTRRSATSCSAAGRSVTRWASIPTATASPAAGIRRRSGRGGPRLNRLERPSPNFGPRRDGGHPAPRRAALYRDGDRRGRAVPAVRPRRRGLGALPDRPQGARTSWSTRRRGPGMPVPGRGAALTDVNSRSIGIELANDGRTPFAAAQMAALETLLGDILGRCAMPPEAVIGHSDMAPGRKRDPGPRFDWRRLARAGLSVWPEAEPVPPDWDAFAAGLARVRLCRGPCARPAARGVSAALPSRRLRAAGRA